MGVQDEAIGKGSSYVICTAFASFSKISLYHCQRFRVKQTNSRVIYVSHKNWRVVHYHYLCH